MFNLLDLAQNQWRVGFDGAYGLDYNTFMGMADRLGIEINWTFFRKLRTWEFEALKVMREKEGSTKHETDEEYLESMKAANDRLGKKTQ